MRRHTPRTIRVCRANQGLEGNLILTESKALSNSRSLRPVAPNPATHRATFAIPAACTAIASPSWNHLSFYHHVADWDWGQ